MGGKGQFFINGAGGLEIKTFTLQRQVFDQQVAADQGSGKFSCQRLAGEVALHKIKT